MVEAGRDSTGGDALVYKGEERVGDVDFEGSWSWERHVGRGQLM
jgi:hypothetical protein